MNEEKFKEFQLELKNLLDKYNINFQLSGYDCEGVIDIIDKETDKIFKSDLDINENNLIG